MRKHGSSGRIGPCEGRTTMMKLRLQTMVRLQTMIGLQTLVQQLPSLPMPPSLPRLQLLEVMELIQVQTQLQRKAAVAGPPHHGDSQRGKGEAVAKGMANTASPAAGGATSGRARGMHMVGVAVTRTRPRHGRTGARAGSAPGQIMMLSGTMVLPPAPQPV